MAVISPGVSGRQLVRSGKGPLEPVSFGAEFHDSVCDPLHGHAGLLDGRGQAFDTQVAVGDGGAGPGIAGLSVGWRRLSGGKGLGRDDLGEPCIELRDDGVLADVDGAWVIEVGGDGPGGAELAAVEDASVAARGA
jgi:hypothetical protein